MINSLGGGGAQGVCVSLANALAERGHGVVLIVLNLRGATRVDDLSSSVQLVDLGVTRSRWAFVPLMRRLRRTDADEALVFSLPLFLNLALMKWAGLWRGRLLVRGINMASVELSHRREFVRHFVIEPLAKRLYRRADAVIAQTDAMALDLRERYGLESGRMHVIHNPVSPRIAHRAALFNEQPPERPVPGRYLLFAGRLDYQKNLEGLLQALQLFHRRVSDTVLVLAGAGPYEDRLREKALVAGLAEHVRFVGYQADLAPWYWHAEATVLASHYEGLPNVLIESIVLGTPVVAFDSPGGTGDVVLPGENGFLVPYPDVEAFADALVQLVETRPFEREQAMAAAQRFDRERIVDQYEQVLRS